jgi:hypothetical protein
MKTISILTALLLISVTYQQAVTGCTADKCATCSTSTGCTLCTKEPTTAMASPNTAFKECKGTAVANCESYTSAGLCASCATGFSLMTVTGASPSCAANHATITAAAKCVMGAAAAVTTAPVSPATLAAADTICGACLGAFCPEATGAVTAGCKATTAPTGLVNCAAHKGLAACAWCNVDWQIKTADDTCETWGTADNVGCHDTACSKCAVIHGYYAIMGSGKRCAKPVSATTTVKYSAILGATILAVAMLFNF